MRGKGGKHLLVYEDTSNRSHFSQHVHMSFSEADANQNTGGAGCSGSV